MCSEYEPDRRLRDDQEQAQEEIRRLFERYRLASHGEVAAEAAAEPAGEQEPALAAR